MSEPVADDRVTVVLSPRDLQWVAAALAVTGGLLVDDDDYETDAENLQALRALLVRHYSCSEVNAVIARFRELLPIDAPMTFLDHDAPFAPRTPALLS